MINDEGHKVNKTDNPAQVGMHVFTRSNLGAAPFRCIGVHQKLGPIHMADGTEVGSPGQPMGVCAHCGTGIADCYEIRSADGNTFVVGSSCVEKTGDAGLLRSYKNSPAVRAFRRAKREVRAKAVNVQLTDLLAASKEKLEVMMIKKWNGQMESQFDYFKRIIPQCGASGRSRYLKHLRCLLNL